MAGVQQQSINNIELIDVEEVTPHDDNSLFLSVSRILIYLSCKFVKLAKLLNDTCHISYSDLSLDSQLQRLLRLKVCQYLIENGVRFDLNKRKLVLASEYTTLFKDNVYEFMVQVYQLTFNNYSKNLLFRKFALPTLANLLGVKLCVKKSTGQWRFYEPGGHRNRQNTGDLFTIYLQELKSDTGCKFFRILVEKRLWLSNHEENWFINTTRFSQFNDHTQIRAYKDQSVVVEFKSLLTRTILVHLDSMSIYERVFCGFMCDLPPLHVLSKVSDLVSKANELFHEPSKTTTRKLTSSTENRLVDKEINSFGELCYQIESTQRDSTKLTYFFNMICGKNVIKETHVNREIQYVKI